MTAGYPDHLSGLAIPLGARILAVTNDYDSLVQGNLATKGLGPDEARAFMLAARGKRHDPVVVEAFVKMQGGNTATAEKAAGCVVPSAQLEPGMVLARDLTTREGVLLLARDFVLEAALIAQIRGFERAEGCNLHIVIQERKP